MAKDALRTETVVRLQGRKYTLAQLNARLKGAADKGRDFSIPHKKISIMLDRWVQVNFRTEGGKVGGWKPLAAGGRFISNGQFDPNAKILQDTGRLRASFEPFYSRRNAGIGSDLVYSKKHDKGLDGLPKRRILPEEREVRDDIETIFEQHVDRMLDL